MTTFSAELIVDSSKIIGNISKVAENDLVSFWSEELPINEFSNKNGLISYELMTRITKRVKVKVT